ncbi:hypothetical protein HAZT_HAZT011167 [Hyalella azteca]|uniref:Xrn1 N-terminal domain-containing protein n=1 Tax=Hyalella azteca TaxID=294128 RepID=A0A6A0H0N1_HYAAZ|nr:hypothetical protein HAZT_HAZT011167 [Hyalella azteca]
MGVPKFYRWISKRYPTIVEDVRHDQVPEFDNLYLDMNGIIHSCSHPDEADPCFRITEDQIFEDILHYIESLFCMIRPEKVFFLAIDGRRCVNITCLVMLGLASHEPRIALLREEVCIHHMPHHAGPRLT